MHRTLFFPCIVAALAVLPVPPAAATESDAFDVPACHAPQPQNAFVPACLVEVPNGDFRGVAAPAGGETGSHWHPWEPTFRWFGLPPSLHAIADHLRPWQFRGVGRPDYRSTIHGHPGVVLSRKDDAIFQWIPVKPLDGSQPHEIVYRVRITYAPHAQRSGSHVMGPLRASAALGIKLIVADGATERLSQVFHDRQVASEERPATWTATVTVPANTPVSQLGVAIAADDDTPLLVEKVELLQKTAFWFDD